MDLRLTNPEFQYTSTATQEIIEFALKKLLATRQSLTVGSGLPCTMHSSCALSPGAACTNGVSTRTSGGSGYENDIQ